MVQLKPRLQEMLEFIRRFMAENGYAPTIRDIAQGLSISSFTTVKKRLDALAQLGCIERAAGYARGIRLLQPCPSFTPDVGVRIPLLGRISAGQPVLAQQEGETTLCLPPEMVGAGEFFALRVKGDSMIRAGICDADVVVIRQQRSAENGEIVAALIGEEATVKRFYRENDHVRLQPDNPDYLAVKVIDPIILGKVVTVVRSLAH